MPSQLTRLVFRSIIANEPLFYRGCCYRVSRPRTTAHHAHHAHHAPRFSLQMQRRTFFNMFKSRRKIKPLDAPPGLDTMGDLIFAKKNAVRPPKTHDVADALKSFFAQKKGTFEEFHIIRAHTAFTHLLENPQENGQPWLQQKELVVDILHKMLDPAKLPDHPGQAHLAFGRALLDEVSRMMSAKEQSQQREKTVLSEDLYIKSKLVKLLSLCGAAGEARDIAADWFPCDPSTPADQLQASLRVWTVVLVGLAQDGNVEELAKTAELLKLRSIPLSRTMQERLVVFFCDQNDLKRAKFWYAQPLVSWDGKESVRPLGTTTSTLLKASALSGDMTFGQKVVAAMLKDDMPEKPDWDAIFVWSAAIGKGADEVDRMMSVLVRRNDEARQKNPKVDVIRPDITTINSLVELSISKQDPYSAERYITLGEKWGISPNEKTFAMQMQYRINVGDLDGARAAYFNFQGSFSGAKQSVAVVNQLIQALCKSKQHHFDEMMAMVDDLHERKASFSPETVAALVLLHLQRGEIPDAIDLLQLHSLHYSPEQRAVIRETLSAFILDGETSTADAWDGYQILRNSFPETSREDRIRVMKGFFARKRSDMACHVFFHMRNQTHRAINANHDVYVAAFTGFGHCEDAESLELAHNQLRLDLNVDIDTKLRNALMLAYAAVKENLKALQLWKEICDSREGPSYNSIPIAFRSCEGMHWGGEHAKSIWERLQAQDVEIDKTIWTAYMCAIARNHHHDEALAMIEGVEEEYGFTPDLDILGSWFNTTASSERQTHVEAWIKERYPEVWKEIEALGHWVTMDGFGYRQYNFNRDLQP